MNYLAIDIGGTYTKYGILSEEGTILQKGKTPTIKDSQEHFVASLVEIYHKEAAAFGAEGAGIGIGAGKKNGGEVGAESGNTGDENVSAGCKDLAEPYHSSRIKSIGGIAISCAGFIDSERGILHNAGSLYCVKDLPVVSILEERCGVPASIGNDARCAAMAELWKGTLRDCRNAVAIIIGTAVGGTVIIDRKVVEGRNKMAGEFSYILANADTPMDASRNYALYGGMPALIALVSNATGIPEEALDGEKIFAMVRAGRQEVEACVRTYAQRLAVLIRNLSFVVDPDRVAVGGGVSAEPMLIGLIREELQKLSSIYPYKVSVPPIAPCQYGNDANLIGALYLFLQKNAE